MSLGRLDRFTIRDRSVMVGSDKNSVFKYTFFGMLVQTVPFCAAVETRRYTLMTRFMIS
jgi:hypothetical protein